MKFLPENYSYEDLVKAFNRQYRRIVALEGNTAVILPTSAPRSPEVNQAWHDIENGKLNIWNGSTWNTFTKD
jgi:hypothetical protein